MNPTVKTSPFIFISFEWAHQTVTLEQYFLKGSHPASHCTTAGTPPSAHTHIPPDHVSECSGCDMAHPQLAHTHFCEGGRGGRREWGRGGSVRGREGGKGRCNTHYSVGGGDSSVLPHLLHSLSPHFLPLQLIYVCMCVHLCVCMRAAGAHACVSDMWPAATASILTLWESQCGKRRERRESWGESWETNSKLNSKVTLYFTACHGGKGFPMKATVYNGRCSI